MKFYVLKYPSGGFVGVDEESGGYPWNADNRLDMAKIWAEPFYNDMVRYQQTFILERFKAVEIIDADSLAKLLKA